MSTFHVIVLIYSNNFMGSQPIITSDIETTRSGKSKSTVIY